MTWYYRVGWADGFTMTSLQVISDTKHTYVGKITETSRPLYNFQYQISKFDSGLIWIEMSILYLGLGYNSLAFRLLAFVFASIPKRTIFLAAKSGRAAFTVPIFRNYLFLKYSEPFPRLWRHNDPTRMHWPKARALQRRCWDGRRCHNPASNVES